MLVGPARAVIEEMGAEQREPADVVRRRIASRGSRPGRSPLGARGGSDPKAYRRRRASPRRAAPRSRRRARSCTGSARTHFRRRLSSSAVFYATRVLVPSAFTRMSLLDRHHLLVESRLDHLVVAARMRGLAAASGSSGPARCRSATPAVWPAGGASTTCLPCRRLPLASSRPTSSRVRPGAAISRSLTIGATACDARLEFTNSTRTSIGFFGSSARKSLAVGIALAEVIDAVEDVLGAPVPELAMVEDRVDHRWSVARLDPAGVQPPDAKPCGSALITGMMDALRRDASLLSVVGSRAPRTPGRRGGSTGSPRPRADGSGPPPVVYVRSAAGMRFKPGLNWFFDRGSAPARKWQLAQACMPSLPTCMSQKSALPRARAMAGSLTNSSRFYGPGTGTDPQVTRQVGQVAAQRRIGHAGDGGIRRRLSQNDHSVD